MVSDDFASRVTLPVFENEPASSFLSSCQGHCPQTGLSRTLDHNDIFMLKDPGTFTSMFNEGDSPRIVEEAITALEDGKEYDFRRTCDELGLFLQALRQQESSKNISISEALTPGGRSSGLASCHTGRVILPDNWMLPDTLPRSWPDFNLITDLDDWKLHSSTIAALRCAFCVRNAAPPLH